MKKTHKELANIGVDFIIASRFRRNEEIEQISDEINKLNHEDVKFILGIFAGFFHEICKTQEFYQLSEDEMKSIAESIIVKEHEKEN